MATQPTFSRYDAEPVPVTARQSNSRSSRDSKERNDPFKLRALPHEDVFFFCKRIDNSRLIREQVPRTRGACLRFVGAACVLLLMVGGAFAPSVAGTLA